MLTAAHVVNIDDGIGIPSIRNMLNPIVSEVGRDIVETWA